MMRNSGYTILAFVDSLLLFSDDMQTAMYGMCVLCVQTSCVSCVRALVCVHMKHNTTNDKDSKNLLKRV